MSQHNSVKYKSASCCPKCNEPNDMQVVEFAQSHVAEAYTVCRKCNHKDYFAYGFYESESEPPQQEDKS